MAVDCGLQIDFAHALEHADEEGVDGHQTAGMRGFDVPFAELGREAFEQSDLVLPEFDLALGGGLLQTQQPLVLGEQVVALPDPANPACGDGHALKAKFLLDAG